MRLKRSAVALATASLLTLAACGGGGDDDSGASDPRDSVDTENLGNTGSGTDPDREGPVTIEGATEGGTVTVLTELGLTTPLDPSDLYYTDTNAIMTALVTRSLTQYSYDEESGQMILVPDLATDLGTPNEDFTEWKFTLRDGVKWETGAPVTAEEVAFGIVRSMDGKTFPNGPGLSYSNAFFLGGEDYKGPYTDPGGYDAQQAVIRRRQHHHRQDVQAVPGLRLLRELPGHRSDPDRPGRQRPGDVRPEAPRDRPVQDRPVHRRQVAHAGPQRPVGPGH